MPATRHDGRIRLPRTTNERRAYEPQIEDIFDNVDIDVKIHIRGKRLPNSLPNSYDDIFRTDKDDISWKNNGYGIKRRRKKQWM